MKFAHHRVRGRALALCWTALVLGPVVAAGDGIELLLQRTDPASDPELLWTGRQPTYEIWRSDDPLTLRRLPSRVFETSDLQWSDPELPVPILYYSVTSRPPVLDDLLSSANEMAGFMETNRVLPASVTYGTGTINPAQFLLLAVRALKAMTSDGPFPSAVPAPGLTPPADPYPSIVLDDAFYREPFSKDSYLGFFEHLGELHDSGGRFPAVVTVPGKTAEVRFCEAVYYAAGVLRARQMLGALPETWNRFIIATKGLVPWETPTGYEAFTSALEHGGGWAFQIDKPRRYYVSAAHDYSMFELARSIYGSETDPFAAGESLMDWVVSQWISVVGYTSGRSQLGIDQSGWERAHWYYHTSGFPRRITSALHRAAGIPSSMGGAAYFDGPGWVNIDQHRPYGSDPLDNPFYYDGIPPPLRNNPHPQPSDDFVVQINDTAVRPAAPAEAGELRTIFVSPKDVLDYGAVQIVEKAAAFDAIVLTVKSVQGYVYFGASGWPEREKQDALGPLLSAAQAAGKKVYAGFATLGDRKTSAEQPGWRQMLNESGSYPNLLISPCVQQYQNTLTLLLQNLLANHDVDGVVLAHLYYGLEFGSTDTVGHPDCPTGTDWMPGVVTDYAMDLVDTIENAAPSTDVLLMSYRLGVENRYSGLTPPVEVGYQDLFALSQVVDGIILPFVGSYWTPHSSPYWLNVIDDYRQLTDRNPIVSFMLVDEWEYDSLYYRGVAHRARERGVSGIGFHTPLSTTGELSPALSRSLWETVGRIRLDPGD